MLPQTHNSMQALIAPAVVTMSSREIAALTGRRHDQVLRTARELVEQGVTQSVETQYIHEQNGQAYPEHLLNKRDSLILVARLSPEFTAAVVDRWLEIESSSSPIPDFTNPAIAARAWAEQYEAKQIAVSQLAAAAPKVQFFDTVVQRNNLMNATQVGQKLGLSAMKLNKVLDELDVYHGGVKRGRVFKQWFIDKGYGELKQTEQGFPQPLFTPAGEAWVVERLISEGYEVRRVA